MRTFQLSSQPLGHRRGMCRPLHTFWALSSSPRASYSCPVPDICTLRSRHLYRIALVSRKPSCHLWYHIDLWFQIGAVVFEEAFVQVQMGFKRLMWLTRLLYSPFMLVIVQYPASMTVKAMSTPRELRRSMV